MDVPIGPARTTRVASAFWLVGSAHAATIEHAAHVVSIEHAAHVATIEHTAHVVVRARPELGSTTWAVQVGVYRNEKMAREAAFAAHRMADRGEPRIEPIIAHGRRIWRAQLAGLNSARSTGRLQYPVPPPGLRASSCIRKCGNSPAGNDAAGGD